MVMADILIWLALVVSAALYWWVGKVYVAQPKFNHPAIFWNATIATILLATPPLGLLLCVVGGFIYTDIGWWYLGAAVLASIALPSKPTRF